MKNIFLYFIVTLTSLYADNGSFRETRVNFLNKIVNSKDEKILKSPYYKRILTTLSCKDSDAIPKVHNAGKCLKDLKSGYDVQIMHNGVKVVKDCYYGRRDPWMTHIISGLSGHHEPQEEKAFHEVLKYIPQDGTMIELGSYWAYYSLWFQHNQQSRRSILIEPGKGNLKIGQRNFELNNKKGDFIQGFIGLNVKDPLLVKSSVPLINLNQVFISRSISKLHILHSDIQGSELPMLKSIRNRIKSKQIDWMFISTHSDKIHSDCLTFLQSQGMSIVCEHNCSESYSCDGLIVCKAKDVPGPDYIELSKRGITSVE